GGSVAVARGCRRCVEPQPSTSRRPCGSPTSISRSGMSFAMPAILAARVLHMRSWLSGEYEMWPVSKCFSSPPRAVHELGRAGDGAGAAERFGIAQERLKSLRIGTELHLHLRQRRGVRN